MPPLFARETDILVQMVAFLHTVTCMASFRGAVVAFLHFLKTSTAGRFDISTTCQGHEAKIALVIMNLSTASVMHVAMLSLVKSLLWDAILSSRFSQQLKSTI